MAATETVLTAVADDRPPLADHVDPVGRPRRSPRWSGQRRRHRRRARAHQRPQPARPHDLVTFADGRSIQGEVSPPTSTATSWSCRSTPPAAPRSTGRTTPAGLGDAVVRRRPHRRRRRAGHLRAWSAAPSGLPRAARPGARRQHRAHRAARPWQLREPAARRRRAAARAQHRPPRRWLLPRAARRRRSPRPRRRAGSWRGTADRPVLGIGVALRLGRRSAARVGRAAAARRGARPQVVADGRAPTGRVSTPATCITAAAGTESLDVDDLHRVLDGHATGSLAASPRPRDRRARRHRRGRATRRQAEPLRRTGAAGHG